MMFFSPCSQGENFFICSFMFTLISLGDVVGDSDGSSWGVKGISLGIRFVVLQSPSLFASFLRILRYIFVFDVHLTPRQSAKNGNKRKETAICRITQKNKKRALMLDVSRLFYGCGGDFSLHSRKYSRFGRVLKRTPDTPYFLPCRFLGVILQVRTQSHSRSIAVLSCE